MRKGPKGVWARKVIRRRRAARRAPSDDDADSGVDEKQGASDGSSIHAGSNNEDPTVCTGCPAVEAVWSGMPPAKLLELGVGAGHDDEEALGDRLLNVDLQELFIVVKC